MLLSVSGQSSNSTAWLMRSHAQLLFPWPSALQSVWSSALSAWKFASAEPWLSSWPQWWWMMTLPLKVGPIGLVSIAWVWSTSAKHIASGPACAISWDAQESWVFADKMFADWGLSQFYRAKFFCYTVYSGKMHQDCAAMSQSFARTPSRSKRWHKWNGWVCRK